MKSLQTFYEIFLYKKYKIFFFLSNYKILNIINNIKILKNVYLLTIINKNQIKKGRVPGLGWYR